MCGLAINGLSPSEAATLSDPKRCSEFGLILDPSCGVGSFLAEVIDQLGESLETRNERREALAVVDRAKGVAVPYQAGGTRE
jgi:type I restriction-modification system DNA methylase subunit